jgi:hypothetical protein
MCRWLDEMQHWIFRSNALIFIMTRQTNIDRIISKILPHLFFFETSANCHIATRVLHSIHQHGHRTGRFSASLPLPPPPVYSTKYAIMNTLNVIMVTVPMSFPLHCHYSSHLSVSQTIVINCARRSNTVDYKSSHSKRPRKQPL